MYEMTPFGGVQSLSLKNKTKKIPYGEAKGWSLKFIS